MATFACKAVFDFCGLARALSLFKDDNCRHAYALPPNSTEARQQLHQRIVQTLIPPAAHARAPDEARQYAAVRTHLETLLSTDGTLDLSRAFSVFGNPATSQKTGHRGEAASPESHGRLRVHLELGCGDGEYAIACAHRAREQGKDDVVWVCVELRLDRAVDAWMSVVRSRLPNVLVVCCDAGTLLRRYLRNGSVQLLIIRFPQPPPSLVAARRSGDVGCSKPAARPRAGARDVAARDGGGQDDHDRATGVGGGGNMLSRESFRDMWRVLRPKACLRLVTDSLACARLACAAAAGEHEDCDPAQGVGSGSQGGKGDESANPCAWVSERLCVGTRRDPLPACSEQRKRGEVVGKEPADGGVDIVLEEEIHGVHIYRTLDCDRRSFFGRMWKRRQGHNFLLHLRKSGSDKRVCQARVAEAAFYL